MNNFMIYSGWGEGGMDGWRGDGAGREGGGGGMDRKPYDIGRTISHTHPVVAAASLSILN